MTVETTTTFFDILPYQSWFWWMWVGGAVYYFLCYHLTHRVLCRTPVHKTVTRTMSKTRFQQQVRNMSIVPFLCAATFGALMSFKTGSGMPVVRFQGLISGCYVFEVLELLWNRRYTLAAHHVVAIALYLTVWFYGEVPQFVCLTKMCLFLGSTFAADVAHHMAGMLIHFVGKEKRFVRYFLMFSACCYAGRMACALYCGIYALLFLSGVFGWSLVIIAAFCLTIDRFLWFPNILRAYGLRGAAVNQQDAPIKPAFQLPTAPAAAATTASLHPVKAE